MSLVKELLDRSQNPDKPFLVSDDRSVTLRQISGLKTPAREIGPGEVVALVGDFDASTLATLFELLDRRAIIVPLTRDTAPRHEYFLKTTGANAIIENGALIRLDATLSDQPLINTLRSRGNPGLVLFTSGTTGAPKAILHDFDKFLKRYATPRPAWTTLSFLLFDHIGGLNTLFHTLYNDGRVVRPCGRTPAEIIRDIRAHNIELLPATPTFFRLLLLSGLAKPESTPSLRLLTYGTERMDEPTLEALASAFPSAEIRQTYGMSELGIMRVKTRKRDELWIKIGGEGAESRIVDGELQIRSKNRMEGYLNAVSPFTADGWLATQDLVANDGSWIKITGRKDDVINVGGLKVLPAEIERAALKFPGIALAKAGGKANPLTGNHVELLCQPVANASVDKGELLNYLKRTLPAHAVPMRIKFGEVPVGHRFKKL